MEVGLRLLHRGRSAVSTAGVGLHLLPRGRSGHTEKLGRDRGISVVTVGCLVTVGNWDSKCGGTYTCSNSRLRLYWDSMCGGIQLVFAEHSSWFWTLKEKERKRNKWSKKLTPVVVTSPLLLGCYENPSSGQTLVTSHANGPPGFYKFFIFIFFSRWWIRTSDVGAVILVGPYRASQVVATSTIWPRRSKTTQENGFICPTNPVTSDWSLWPEEHHPFCNGKTRHLDK